MFKQYTQKLVPSIVNARVDQAKYSMVIYLLKTLLNGSPSLSAKAEKPLMGLILSSYLAEAPLKYLDNFPIMQKIHAILKEELPDFSMDISFLTKMTFSIWILSLNQAGKMTMITDQQFWLVLGAISAFSTLNVGITKRDKIIAKFKECFNESNIEETDVPLLNDEDHVEMINQATGMGKKLGKAWSLFWDVIRFSALSFALISKVVAYIDNVDATTDLLIRTIGAPLVGGVITLLQECNVLSMEQSMDLMNYLMAINLEWSTINSVISSEGTWGIGTKVAYGLTYVPTLFTAISNTRSEIQEQAEDKEFIDNNSVILNM